ncbi:reductase [Lithospermum erythrorhizon]|uniref:Reductase n=1 Tax=Lithospermum erythrorhizon TaxID=34254 RepID=A0AAV3PJP5_LITER
MSLINIINKRRTWFFLIILIYTILLSLSYNLLKTVLSCNASNLNSSALRASLLLGVAFGMLSVVAASAVVIPSVMVSWITVLVLLNFTGKSRRTLVSEGKKLCVDITTLLVKFLFKEGNIVALISAVLGFFAFVNLKGRETNDGTVSAGIY